MLGGACGQSPHAHLAVGLGRFVPIQLRFVITLFDLTRITMDRFPDAESAAFTKSYARTLVGLAALSFLAYLLGSAAVREAIVWIRTIISRTFFA